MYKERVWLQECNSAYQSLLFMCESNSVIDDDFNDFRNNLSNFVSKIFDIFQNMNSVRAEFLFHDKGQVGEIYNKKLYLCVYFPKKNFQKVKQWFDKTSYQEWSILSSNKIGESVFKIPVLSIIDKLQQDEIRELRMDCEEKAKPFLEGRENEILSDYEEKCLTEDEYYLGVRFISYDGEYPNYCKGNLVLEIEGVQYCFRLFDLLSDGRYYIQGIKPEVFPENIRRYYHEIIRVMKNNLAYTCCGGCN